MRPSIKNLFVVPLPTHFYPPPPPTKKSYFWQFCRIKKNCCPIFIRKSWLSHSGAMKEKMSFIFYFFFLYLPTQPQKKRRGGVQQTNSFLNKHCLTEFCFHSIFWECVNGFWPNIWWCLAWDHDRPYTILKRVQNVSPVVKYLTNLTRCHYPDNSKKLWIFSFSVLYEKTCQPDIHGKCKYLLRLHSWADLENIFVSPYPTLLKKRRFGQLVKKNNFGPRRRILVNFKIW